MIVFSLGIASASPSRASAVKIDFSEREFTSYNMHYALRFIVHIDCHLPFASVFLSHIATIDPNTIVFKREPNPTPPLLQHLYATFALRH